MGNENWGLVAIGGISSFIASVLYMWGGTAMSWGGQKWLRRFLASFVIALSSNGIALYLQEWQWQYILIWPCLIFGFSLGYGGESTSVKLLKRTVFALGCLTACLVGLWISGFVLSGWLVFGIATLIGITSVILGVFNPFNNAPLEQFIICQLLTMFVPFWAFVK